MTLPNLEAKLKAGSYDLALVSYAMDVCPDPGFILMKGNTGNYFRYKSEKMDNLCKSLRTQVTQEGFRQKLMEILFHDIVILVLICSAITPSGVVSLCSASFFSLMFCKDTKKM